MVDIDSLAEARTGAQTDRRGEMRDTDVSRYLPHTRTDEENTGPNPVRWILLMQNQSQAEIVTETPSGHSDVILKAETP